MHKRFTYTALLLVVLLNGTITYTMQPPFGLLDLPSELDPQISSYTDPKTIGNLSLTCHRLNEKISFQTPHIWDIVCHSLDCISDKKMPQLLVKARLCKEHATSDEEKSFLENMEKKILERYNPTTFQFERWQHYNGATVDFDPFLENQRSKSFIDDCPLLFSACFTNDKNIVMSELSKNSQISEADIFTLRNRVMQTEQTSLLPILCKHFAPLFEAAFALEDFRWTMFFANISILEQKYKSFEALINHYKQHLNRIDADNMTYLDFLLACQEEGLMKHGGMYYYEQNSKTMKFDHKSMPQEYIFICISGKNDLIIYRGAYQGNKQEIKCELKNMFFEAKNYAKAYEKYIQAHDQCGSIVMHHGGKLTIETPAKRTSSTH